jgi:hypothetical protein
VKADGGAAFRLIFGMLALVIGLAVILWVVCNEFVHRFPQYTGTHWWEPLGIGPIMVGTGFYWLRTLHSSSNR